MELSEKACSVLSHLDALGIKYEVIRHKAVFSCEESRETVKTPGAVACKNLFVKDIRSGIFYLIVLKSEKHADLKSLAGYVGAGRFVFADDNELLSKFGVERGSVSPFALLNDKERKVRLMMDEEVLSSEKIRFHPNDNTATVVLSSEDFLKYADSVRAYIMRIRTGGR